MEKRSPYRALSPRDTEAIGDRIDVRLGEAVGTPGASTVRLADPSQQLVRLGARLRASAAHIHSRSNDNQEFLARVDVGPRTVDGQSVPLDARVYLGVDDQWWSGVVCLAGAEGPSIARVCKFPRYGYFQLGRSTALELARLCAVAPHERAPLDACVTYAWEPPQVFERSGPAPVSLRIRNTGTSRLVLSRSLEALSFEAVHDGVPAALPRRGILNAPSCVEAIAPGQDLVVTADVRAWLPLDRRGAYALTARFAGQLESDGVPAGEAFLHAAVWDVASKWSGTVHVA